MAKAFVTDTERSVSHEKVVTITYDGKRRLPSPSPSDLPILVFKYYNCFVSQKICQNENGMLTKLNSI